MQDKLYSFVMKGELTKVSLDRTKTISKHKDATISDEHLIKSLALEILDDDFVQRAKKMAVVYTAIAAFENSVREFITKKLLEQKGENWWEECVPQKIQQRSNSRREEELKTRCFTCRGDSMIDYVEFGDLASIMHQNQELFEDHIISIEWARQIFQSIERSRNVIMHSGELDLRDIERIGVNIRDWISQVGG